MSVVDVSQHHDVIDQAQQVLSHHAKSFRLAAIFLPQKKANDAAIVYQFCRILDDAVDEAPDLESARLEARRLQEELHGVRPPSQEVESYLAVAQRLDIPEFVAHDLLAGITSDLDVVAVQSKRELAQYCYRVAGTVGLMMCAVLGVTKKEAWPFAIDLGLGMQLTNIARDVLEDAQRGRVYLPDSFLRMYGASSDDVCNQTITVNARKQTIDHLLMHAENSYARARTGMRFIPIRARLAIFIAMRVYRAIGITLQRRYNSDPFHGRTVVSRWGKGIAVLHGILDFLDPRTWFFQRSESSLLYENWNDLREEIHPSSCSL